MDEKTEEIIKESKDHGSHNYGIDWELVKT